MRRWGGMPWSAISRRSGAPAEALAGRKAGTDQGAAIVRSRPREFQKASARESPEGSLREALERQGVPPHRLLFLFQDQVRAARAADERALQRGGQPGVRPIATDV